MLRISFTVAASPYAFKKSDMFPGASSRKMSSFLNAHGFIYAQKSPDLRNQGIISTTKRSTNLLPSRLYCRYRNHTGSCPEARGLYRRSGITPCPEDYMYCIHKKHYIACIIYMQALFCISHRFCLIRCILCRFFRFRRLWLLCRLCRLCCFCNL